MGQLDADFREPDHDLRARACFASLFDLSNHFDTTEIINLQDTKSSTH